jgi:hypothetical protein
MLSIHAGREIVRWNNKGRLMAHIQHQLWLTRAGTGQLGGINSVLMAPFPVISMVLMEVRLHRGYFILHLHLDFHSLPELSLHWGRAPAPVDSTSLLVSISCLSPLVPEHCLFFTISLCCVYAMPHERGKPKRGPAYYNFVARHRRSGPSLALSLPPNPFTSPVGPPHSDQNWHDDAQLPLDNLEPMPQNLTL